MQNRKPRSPDLNIARARGLRSSPTRSEAALFEELRSKKLGVAFRRQVPIGARYIADFLAPAPRLVVEVDGEIHARRESADARRDRVLRRLGYRVLRLDAELVLKNIDEAVSRIRAALAEPL